MASGVSSTDKKKWLMNDFMNEKQAIIYLSGNIYFSVTMYSPYF